MVVIQSFVPSLIALRRDIAEYASERAFPIIPCDLCGSQSNLKRARIKRLIEDLEHEIPHVRASMLNALGNAIPSHLLDHDLFDFKNLRAGTGSVESELDLAVGHTDEDLRPTLVSLTPASTEKISPLW